MIDDYKVLFNRDLNWLKKEIELFFNDSDFWFLLLGIVNFVGNFMFYLCGNLCYFIGDVMGKFGYVRKWEEEFFIMGFVVVDLLKFID